MRTKTLTLTLAAVAATATLAATPVFAEEVTNISFYTTQSGTDEQFKAVIAEFEKQNPDIKVEYLGYDSSELQKWMSLYASNDAPTVALIDPINISSNKERMAVFDPAKEVFLENVDPGALATYTYDGNVYGVPISVQGYGILYNKTAIETATGEEFDPSQIKTRADLRALYEKIAASDSGIAPAMFTGADWSLGSHFLGLAFSGCRGDSTAQTEYVEKIKAGEIDFKSDEYWNALMDTFDLIKEFNYNAVDPIVGNVDIDAQAFATGKAATWFNGDWSWVQIKDVEGRGEEFGILPVFMSDDPEDPLNQIIPTSAPKAYCVDASQNDEAQVAAGKRFVEFITMEPFAQEQIGQALGATLPYKNTDFVADSPLAASTAAYVAEGKTLDIYGVNLLLPSDFWLENGVPMLQYLSDVIDRDAAADMVQEYWMSQK